MKFIIAYKNQELDWRFVEDFSSGEEALSWWESRKNDGTYRQSARLEQHFDDGRYIVIKYLN